MKKCKNDFIIVGFYCIEFLDYYLIINYICKNRNTFVQISVHLTVLEIS